MKQRPKNNVTAFGITSFFNDMGSDMILPVLPLFIVTTLGAPVTLLGLIEGVANSTSSVLKLFAGSLSDKIGKRKTLVIAGYSISGIMKPLFFLAMAWEHVLAVRFVERLGKGVRTAPRDALLSESVRRGKSGRAFGLRQMFDSMGSVAGALIATTLLVLAFTYREIFMFALIPSVIAVMVVALFVKEIKHAPLKRYEFPWKNHFSRDFKIFLAAVTLFNVANFSYAFFLLRAQEIGLEIILIPVVYIVYTLFYAFFSYPAGKLSDRIGRKKVIGIGYLLFAATAAGFASIPGAIILWPLFALYGIQIAFTDAISRSFVADLVNVAHRGTGMGAYHMMVGLAALPASIIAGAIWDIYGSSMTFSLAAGLALVALLLLATVRRG